MEALRAGKFAAARDGFRMALREAPSNSGLWAYLGLAEGNLNNTREAIDAFERARSLAPDDPQILFDLGALYAPASELQKALEAYREGLRIQPDDLAANQNYSLLLMRDKQFEQALAPLRKLVVAKPDDLSFRTALIECTSKTGSDEDIRREVLVFLELPGTTLEDHLNSAKVLVAARELRPAGMILEDAVRRYDESPEAHAGLGWLFLDARRYEDSVRQLGRAVQLAPEKSAYSLGLAEALLRWKHFGPAFDFLDAVRSRFGTLSDFQYKSGLALYGLQRFREANAAFEALTNAHPDFDRGWFSLANNAVALGDSKKAEAAYRKALTLNPKNPEYYAALGRLLRHDEADRTEEAIRLLTSVLALDTEEAPIREELGFCYARTGDLTKAQSFLELAASAMPDSKEVHVALARIYHKLHKPAAALREKEIVARLDAASDAHSAEVLKARTKVSE